MKRRTGWCPKVNSMGESEPRLAKRMVDVPFWLPILKLLGICNTESQ